MLPQFLPGMVLRGLRLSRVARLIKVRPCHSQFECFSPWSITTIYHAQQSCFLGHQKTRVYSLSVWDEYILRVVNVPNQKKRTNTGSLKKARAFFPEPFVTGSSNIGLIWYLHQDCRCKNGMFFLLENVWWPESSLFGASQSNHIETYKS